MRNRTVLVEYLSYLLLLCALGFTVWVILAFLWEARKEIAAGLLSLIGVIVAGVMQFAVAQEKARRRERVKSYSDVISNVPLYIRQKGDHDPLISALCGVWAFAPDCVVRATADFMVNVNDTGSAVKKFREMLDTMREDVGLWYMREWALPDDTLKEIFEKGRGGTLR